MLCQKEVFLFLLMCINLSLPGQKRYYLKESVKDSSDTVSKPFSATRFLEDSAITVSSTNAVIHKPYSNLTTIRNSGWLFSSSTLSRVAYITLALSKQIKKFRVMGLVTGYFLSNNYLYVAQGCSFSYSLPNIYRQRIMYFNLGIYLNKGIATSNSTIRYRNTFNLSANFTGAIYLVCIHKFINYLTTGINVRTTTLMQQYQNITMNHFLDVQVKLSRKASGRVTIENNYFTNQARNLAPIHLLLNVNYRL